MRLSLANENENRYHSLGGYPITSTMSSTEHALPANSRTVLDVVDAAGPGSHLTAQEIWVRARVLRPRIGFATVHRSLIRLHELGAVLKLDVPGETSAVYEPAAEPHAHFRCTRCAAIRDLAFAVPASTVRALADSLGVAIEREAVTFIGRCERCR